MINFCCILKEISGEDLVALLAASGQPDLAMDGPASAPRSLSERSPTAGWAWKLIAPRELEAAEVLLLMLPDAPGTELCSDAYTFSLSAQELSTRRLGLLSGRIPLPATGR